MCTLTFLPTDSSRISEGNKCNDSKELLNTADRSIKSFSAGAKSPLTVLFIAPTKEAGAEMVEEDTVSALPLQQEAIKRPDNFLKTGHCRCELACRVRRCKQLSHPHGAAEEWPLSRSEPAAAVDWSCRNARLQINCTAPTESPAQDRIDSKVLRSLNSSSVRALLDFLRTPRAAAAAAAWRVCHAGRKHQTAEGAPWC